VQELVLAAFLAVWLLVTHVTHHWSSSCSLMPFWDLHCPRPWDCSALWWHFWFCLRFKWHLNSMCYWPVCCTSNFTRKVLNASYPRRGIRCRKGAKRVSVVVASFVKSVWKCSRQLTSDLWTVCSWLLIDDNECHLPMLVLKWSGACWERGMCIHYVRRRSRLLTNLLMYGFSIQQCSVNWSWTVEQSG
jgi:hypothetical protein